jgi:Ca-activated chloride channel family protein
MAMKKVDWRVLLVRAMPHAIAAGMVGVAWLSFRGGVEWGAPWGSLGLALLAVHLILRLATIQVYQTAALVWSSSEMVRPSNGRTQHPWMSMVAMELPAVCRTAALLGLSVALFRPQTASTIENMTREGIDMVLSMDLSASMLSRDFRPNRLESAKNVAMDFVDSRPFDRIGVVAYEGEAFTQVPITSDHIVVKNGLASLETGQLQGGTAIGTGLAIAVNRLRASEAASKVIVLLTDGENNAGQIEPMDAAQLAKLNGIRVYTIGVGTVGKAKSPVAIRPDGSYKYDWVDVRIDEEVLQGIASLTGARYFRATNADKLKEIYKEIDALEKTEFNVLRYQRKSEASAGWIVLAILGLALEFLLRSTFLKSVAR